MSRGKRRWKSSKRKRWYQQRETRLRELGFLNYTQYVNSPRWKNRREQWYRNHPIACCFVCEKGGVLVLHHITYMRIGAELDRDLVPLCPEHHGEAHFLVLRRKVSLRDAHYAVRKKFQAAG